MLACLPACLRGSLMRCSVSLLSVRLQGLEDCDLSGGELSGALQTYFKIAKRVSLYLARISPQQTIDHLVSGRRIKRVRGSVLGAWGDIHGLQGSHGFFSHNLPCKDGTSMLS